jgi:hypothetical protein
MVGAPTDNKSSLRSALDELIVESESMLARSLSFWIIGYRKKSGKQPGSHGQKAKVHLQ